MLCGREKFLCGEFSRQKTVGTHFIFAGKVYQRKLSALVGTDVLHGQCQCFAPCGIFAAGRAGLVQTDDHITAALADLLALGVLRQPFRIVPPQKQRHSCG